MSDMFERGLEIRTEVLGPEYVGSSMTGATEFSRPIQDLATEYSWGAIWSRPGLTKKTRSLITLAMLSACEHPHALRIHIRGALRNGCTPDEIQEVFLQAAIYVGMPAAMDCVRLAQEVLDEQQPSRT